VNRFSALQQFVPLGEAPSAPPGRQRSAIAATEPLLATGMIDVLTEIPGVAERLGKTVLHCP